jgi:hypothetical protein
LRSTISAGVTNRLRSLGYSGPIARRLSVLRGTYGQLAANGAPS